MPWWAAACLVVACLALVAGPALLPPGYSVIRHSISESAAQATEGAWLARTGLALLGVSALLTAEPETGTSRWARVSLRLFGVGLMASALWSHSPWLPSRPNDVTEDLLHTLASSLVGAGIINAAAALALRPTERGVRFASVVSLTVSVLAPLVMILDEPRTGLWQRLMFAVAIAWLFVAQRGTRL